VTTNEVAKKITETIFISFVYGSVTCLNPTLIYLKYSLVIEATKDPTFFGFYSRDLEGLTGIGHSIEDCLYQPNGEWSSMLPYLKNNRCQFRRKIPIQKPSYRPKSV
jgi:hypothetical protein